MPTSFRMITDIGTMIQSFPAQRIGHMTRVGALVNVMSEKISRCGPYSKMPEACAYRYYGEAAFYHDIGKAYIPQEILLKPERLTPEEIAIVRRHTLYARELFERIRDGTLSGIPAHLVGLAEDAAVYHHEAWNGRGYPFGISRDGIPLIARITAICDTYDAITSDRPYRKARSHRCACRELEANAGAQFDPKLIEIFLHNERKFSAL